MNHPPLLGICRDPVAGMRPDDMMRVHVGVTIASLAPRAKGLLVCRVNGEWLLRDSWAGTVVEGDVVEFYDVPQDRDTLRGVLTIAAIAALGPYGLALEGAALVAATFAATTLINALLPPVGPKRLVRPSQTGDAFSTSLQGNEARLDQPIWKICGHREITPPFACQPYFEYRTRPGDSDADPDLDNDQYFLALYAVGVGNHDVIPKIGNTPITRFSDVVRATYLPPGTQPTEVQANVTTAEEVSGQVLESGRYVGGYAACAPRRTCSAIGIDVSAPRGLGKTAALTVSWQVEYRVINDYGQVLTAWAVLATESRTAFTATPQRWSDRYELGTDAARVEVRLVRTDTQDTDPSALHELAWIGLRAYLDEPAPLNKDTAHFELVMRASSQLSQGASRDLRLITKAYCRTLASNLTWNAETHTRNWVWWCLDCLTSDTWGLDKDDSRLDLQSFYDLAVQAEARQDRFDYVFDRTMSGWDAAQMIARAGRSRIFRRNGLISIARDEYVDTPVTAFTPRNCLPGISLSESLPQRNSPNGVIVEYQDHRNNEWTEIYCPCPGRELSDMTNPVILRLEGVTGATHAEREGLHEAARLLYRNRNVGFTTEMQGMLPAFMSPVWVQPDIVGYGQSGDVAFWTAGTLTASLSEAPNWDAGDLYISFINDDGTVSTPVRVTPGPTQFDVVLATAPAFTPVDVAGDRERTKFLLGPLIGNVELCKVATISDGGLTEDGAQLYEFSAVVDDERVHTADNALLPGPGTEQDPVGDPDEDTGAVTGGDFIVKLTDHEFLAIYLSGVGSNDLQAEFTLGNNALLTWFIQNGSGTQSGGYTDEWLLSGEAETFEAALFEVRLTLLTSVSPPSVLTSPPLDTWLSLGTSRTVNYAGPGAGSGFGPPVASNDCSIRVEIRDVATSTVQATRTMTLRLWTPETGG